MAFVLSRVAFILGASVNLWTPSSSAWAEQEKPSSEAMAFFILEPESETRVIILSQGQPYFGKHSFVTFKMLSPV